MRMNPQLVIFILMSLIKWTNCAIDSKTVKSVDTQTFKKTFNREKFRCILKVLYARLFDNNIEKMNRFDDHKDGLLSGDEGTEVEGGHHITYSDPYLLKIRSFLLGVGENKKLDPLLEFTDIAFVRMFNQLFIDFNNFKEEYKQQFFKCELDEILVNTGKRCKEKYGNHCQLNYNKVSYGVKCNEGYIPYKGYFCFIKCPHPYIEQYNKCLKPPHKTVRLSTR